MAFALVGVAGAVSVGAAGANVTPAYGQTPTANNLLVLFISSMAVNLGTPTISGWTNAKTTTGTNASASIFYKVAAGSDAAPTVTGFTGAVIAAHLEEWSGGATSSPVDQSGGTFATASPVTATLAAANVEANELVAMVGADFRSTARASNDTWTSNHGTPTLRGSNNGVSSVNHYSHATLVSNSAAAADTAVMTLSITTSITAVVVVAASFKLVPAVTNPPGPFNRSNRLIQHLAQ